MLEESMYQVIFNSVAVKFFIKKEGAMRVISPLQQGFKSHSSHFNATMDN